MLKCGSCGVPIPPEWKNVILRNQCVNCDQPIMNDETKQILDELKEAMSKMPFDFEGLSGWLVSNYKLTKIGSAAPVQQFYSPNMHQQAPQNGPPPQFVNPFMQRAFSNPNGPPGPPMVSMPMDAKMAAMQIVSKLADEREGSGPPGMMGSSDITQGGISKEEADAEREYFSQQPSSNLLMSNVFGPKPEPNLSAGMVLNDPNLAPLENKEIVNLGKVMDSNAQDRQIYNEQMRLQKLQRQEAGARYGGRFSR